MFAVHDNNGPMRLGEPKVLVDRHTVLDLFQVFAIRHESERYVLQHRRFHCVTLPFVSVVCILTCTLTPSHQVKLLLRVCH